MGLPLEELQGTPEETEQHIAKELQSSAKEKRALILKTSHIGGHKYAGNCIVCVHSSYYYNYQEFTFRGTHRSIPRKALASGMAASHRTRLNPSSSTLSSMVWFFPLSFAAV